MYAAIVLLCRTFQQDDTATVVAYILYMYIWPISLQGWSKSKLLILGEYVNKSEKIGGM